MKFDEQLKLQAYLDHELSPRQARQVAEWLAHDAEAQSLCRELQTAKEWAAGHEMEFKVPETREFYWSRIEKEIQRQTQAETRSQAQSWVPGWLRVAAPLAGAAVLLVMLFTVSRLYSRQPGTLASLQEIETPLADTSAISFHSQKDRITVVWVDTSGN